MITNVSNTEARRKIADCTDRGGSNMKATQERSEYKPITIVLETQEEYKFLFGLLNGLSGYRKKDCNNYDPLMDYLLWKKLHKIGGNDETK